jgi:hypothetical protein
MEKLSLKKQVKEILKMAEESGVQSNFLFTTTLERYRTQLSTLERLKKIIEDQGELVTKEYVKGRENVLVHPAVIRYNNIADCANKTVATLIRIIRTFNVEEKSEAIDPLLKILNGSNND